MNPTPVNGSAAFLSPGGFGTSSTDTTSEETFQRRPAYEQALAPQANAVSAWHWVALWGSMLGAFMAVLDIQITNASLNDILGSLGATLTEGSWISTSYLVAEIIVIPLTGWFSEVFSPRRYLVVNAALFLVFSVACA